MQWLDWSDEAFERARAQGQAVFLLVTASWCRWCRELEERVLADAEVQELLLRAFVPVRVDKDRRPDLDARYTKGGWPTLAILDDRGELLYASNFLEVEELRSRLALTAESYAHDRGSLRQAFEPTAEEEEAPHRPALSPAALKRPRRNLGPEVIEEVARTVLETADPVHGGWGARHKFPHPEAIDFALIRWSQTGDQQMLDLVRRTLRNMQAGEIHDQVEGGFYRYATRPDWSVPHHEKMLDSNAQRLFAYLEAYQALGDESFRVTAQGILRWMSATLLDEETGAFRGSQDADPTYARLRSLEARRAHGTPACDPTIFANWNASAVTALLKAAMVLEEERWRRQAMRTLDFLLDALFEPGVGMYHYWDGSPHLPGMLGDQAYVLNALVSASQYTGETRYLGPATQLADLSIEHLRSDTGAFYDTRFDPQAHGVLRLRDRSILDNAVMAEALLRLSRLVHDPDYADCAKDALAAFVNDYKRYGHYVAGYARAVDLLYHEPVQVTVVGPADAPGTRALVSAALRPYVASRIVQTLDPRRDPLLLQRFGFPSQEAEPRAYVQRGRGSYAETSDPSRLPALMTRTERT
jgi:uncharacterized protein YyaL (SSP411 family)